MGTILSRAVIAAGVAAATFAFGGQAHAEWYCNRSATWGVGCEWDSTGSLAWIDAKTDGHCVDLHVRNSSTERWQFASQNCSETDWKYHTHYGPARGVRSDGQYYFTISN